MKRPLLFFLVAAAAYMLSGCGTNVTDISKIEEAQISSEGDPGCQHQYKKEVVMEKSCEVPELVRETCTKCGAWYEYNNDPTGHSYVQSVSNEGTCLEMREYSFTCERCGDVYTEHPGFGPHTWEDGIFLQDEGIGMHEVEGKKCIYCGIWYAEEEGEAQ